MHFCLSYKAMCRARWAICFPPDSLLGHLGKGNSRAKIERSKRDKGLGTEVRNEIFITLKKKLENKMRKRLSKNAECWEDGVEGQTAFR